jgi:LysR family transcriptional regulator, glycine cleavage system transcriptional activator
VTFDSGMLTKLRAFEAVGRNLSFAKAAVELGVTPTALSHHVRHLEAELGAPLLIRLHRRIALTESGSYLLGECSHGLQTMQRAVTYISGYAANNRAVSISVAPFFSARWLTPRLSNFWNAHPEIELQLHHAYLPADFTLERVDAALAWGSGRWTGTNATKVLTGELTALCSPRLARRLPKDPRPDHLLRWKLFYEFEVDHWKQWFAAVNTPVRPTARLAQIDDSHALRKIALDDEGVALFFLGLSREDRETGQLVQPFPVTVDPGSAYYFTWPKDRPMSPQLTSFRDWLFDEISLDPFA